MTTDNAISQQIPRIPIGSGYRLKSRVSSETVPAPQKTNSTYTWSDRFGAWRVRWGIGRDDYRVEPGLYRVGEPDTDAKVLVTANYKLSFDLLRRELGGRNLWLLVLDTKGINVWCAAGKGTFGTAEIVKRVKASGLATFVRHRRLILPQLGAPGVSASEVRRQCGFSVQYGPIRAEDVPAFLDAPAKVTPAMRQVRFSFVDRAVLTPVEMVAAVKPLLLVFGALFILQVLGFARFGLFELLVALGGVLSGSVLVPLLLPWVPGRTFSLKGILLGILTAIGLLWAYRFVPRSSLLADWTGVGGFHPGWLSALSASALMTALSSFLAMNFTGCSTYTSPSGVLKEMKWAIPLQAVMGLAGAFGLLLAGILRVFIW